MNDDKRIIKAIISATLHEFHNTIILDASLLLSHYDICADINNITLTDDDYENMKIKFINLATRYHTISPDGLCTRLTPIIEKFMKDGVIDEQNAQDTSIKNILNDISKFTGDYTQSQRVEMITDTKNVTDFITKNYEKLLQDSFPTQIFHTKYEGNCPCDYCTKFSQNYEIPQHLNIFQIHLIDQFDTAT